jgi:hypothetical protein
VLARAVRNAAPWVTSGDPLGSGRNAGDIQRTIVANAASFRRCFEQGSARNKSLEGTVRVAFAIQANGSVTDVGDAGGTTLPDAQVVTCITREFEKLSFSRADDGQSATVTYPLVFRAKD